MRPPGQPLGNGTNERLPFNSNPRAKRQKHQNRSENGEKIVIFRNF